MGNLTKVNFNRKPDIGNRYHDNSFSDKWETGENVNIKNVASCGGYVNRGNNYSQYEHNNKEKGKKEVFSNMDNNKLLEKYIEKMDRDQSDLRRDIQASEERTSKKISETEQRMDNRLNRIEDMISEQGNAINSLRNYVTQEFRDSIRDNRKFMWGISISITALIIATIIGISQIVLSIK